MPENSKVGQELSHKIELYIVALAFTVAGFAIQTGKFSGNFAGDLFEVVAWVTFVGSGILGLLRIEKILVALWEIDSMEIIGKKMEALAIEQASSNADNAKLIESERVKREELKLKIKKTQDSVVLRYHYQKMLLGVGFCALLLSRFIYQYVENY